jgi:hypothetical protein
MIDDERKPNNKFRRNIVAMYRKNYSNEWYIIYLFVDFVVLLRSCNSAELLDEDERE